MAHGDLLPKIKPQGSFVLIDPAGNKGRDDCAIGFFEVYDAIPALREVDEEITLQENNLTSTPLMLASWLFSIGVEARTLIKLHLLTGSTLSFNIWSWRH